MHLWYWKAPQGNVGDDLNPWLWPRVFGDDFFCESDRERFIGIGSVLDERHNGIPKIVFGAGARSAANLPVDRHCLDIRFVRGPRTAGALASMDAQFISDPAILTPLFHPRNRPQRGGSLRIGFVPYYATPPELSAAIADALDLELIHSTLEVETFIEKLTACDAVVCEAMHGAIIADAYRVPWRACRIVNGVAEGRVSLFKWADWMESLGIDADIPGVLPKIFFYASRRMRAVAFNLWSDGAIGFIDAILREGRWFLSPEARLASAQERILEEAAKLQSAHRTATAITSRFRINPVSTPEPCIV
ncbi:MAG: hypothetical protein U1E46_09215 [Hyphomicrobiales bacterium]